MNRYIAWIFTLGNEIVQGRILNTNAVFIGRRLTLLGFQVIGIISLIDDVDIVAKFIAMILREKPRIIVSTGGLGPTHDDKTLEAIAKAVNKKLVLNEKAFEMIKDRYTSLGYELTEERIKMAYLPENAIPIPNSIGSAPGSWLEIEETIIISLPGVPKEMEVMWDTWIEPRLKTLAPKTHIIEKIVSIEDIAEEIVAPLVKEAFKIFPDVYIKTHPKIDETGKKTLDIYIMYSHHDKDTAEEIARRVTETISERLVKRHNVKIIER